MTMPEEMITEIRVAEKIVFRINKKAAMLVIDAGPIF